LTLSLLWEGLDELDKAGYYRQRFENGFLLIVRRERRNAGKGTFVMRPADC